MRGKLLVLLFILCGIGMFVVGAEIPELKQLAALQRVMQSVAERVAPSVVSIYVERDWTEREGEEEVSALPGRAAGGGGRYRTRPDAPVSGVIIGEDGIVATTHFNVRGKNVKGITVRLPDGREFEAVRLGYDENTDVALLKIDSEELPAVKFSDTSNLKVGQFVVVVGRAEDRKALTVNIGIVSAIGRIRGNCFQHSAQLNYGNAGGAIMDIHGNFLGIASYVSTESPAGQNSGVGFAAPCHKIKERMADMLAGKKIEKVKLPYLGIQGAEGAEDVEGVVVAFVQPNSPAEKAGLMENDLIVEFNGSKVENWYDLIDGINSCKVGQKVKMKVKRKVDGKEQVIELEVIIGARPF